MVEMTIDNNEGINDMKLIKKNNGYYLYQVGNRFFRISNLYSSDWNVSEMTKNIAFDGVIDYEYNSDVCSCNTLKEAKKIITLNNK